MVLTYEPLHPPHSPQYVASDDIKEIFLAGAQITWVAAFALIVTYWMEMQVQSMRLTPMGTHQLT